MHDGSFIKCDACLVETAKKESGAVYPYMSSRVQSQSEDSWREHIEDHKHENDWLRDGRGSE